jgi:hypothetical protein
LRQPPPGLPDPWADLRVRRDLAVQIATAALAVALAAAGLELTLTGAQPALVMATALLLPHALLRIGWRVRWLRPPLDPARAAVTVLGALALVAVGASAGSPVRWWLALSVYALALGLDDLIDLRQGLWMVRPDGAERQRTRALLRAGGLRSAGGVVGALFVTALLVTGGGAPGITWIAGLLGVVSVIAQLWRSGHSLYGWW